VFLAVARERAEGGREQSVILRTSDGGRTWERQLVDPNSWFYDIFFLDDQTGWVCGYHGLILKSTDAGRSWKKQQTPARSSLALLRIQFVDKDRGWAMGEDGVVLRTTDGGTLWELSKVPGRGKLRSLHFSNGATGWVVGEDAEADRSTNGGLIWESLGRRIRSGLPMLDNSVAAFRAVRFFSSDLGFIAANVLTRKGSDYEYQGVLLKTSDGGNSWSAVFLPGHDGLIGAYFLTPSDIWVAPHFTQKLLHTLDGGKSWAEIQPVTDGGAPFSIYFLDTNVGVVIVSYGQFDDEVLYTTDGGRTWANGELPTQ